MKKILLSVAAVMPLAFSVHAVTNMCVEQKDGTIVKYDVDDVVEVYYEEEEIGDDQGVTVSGKVGNYTYVDLGFPSGTKWATYNVGAAAPAEYGGYFSWGETTTKKEYEKYAYKWFSDYDYYEHTVTVNKYCASNYCEIEDGLTVLEQEDDAATVNWGSGWRMPTKAELLELLDGCKWTWVEDFEGTGKSGRLGTSLMNGNTIFLPAAGYYEGKRLLSVGSYGYYWSSTLYDEKSEDACGCYLNASNYCWYNYERHSGKSVRAVVSE